MIGEWNWNMWGKKYTWHVGVVTSYDWFEATCIPALKIVILCLIKSLLHVSYIGLYYEHACNAVYQEMCFHEASKLNKGHSPKTFIAAPSRQEGVTTQQSGGTQSTNLANKSTITQSKASVGSKPQGNLKHASGASIGKDGVQQVGSYVLIFA